VPLTDYTGLTPTISLDEIREREFDIMIIRGGLHTRHGDPLYFPWTPYRNGPLRTFQSYLVKFPKALLPLFPTLQAALTNLESLPDLVPDSDAGVSAVIQDLAGKSRNRSPGQGFQLDQEVRVAVEARAMDAAIEYFSQYGKVDDVHGTESYDLTCTINGSVKHIEVKGTTTAGESVLLTPLEVAHARTYDDITLFVLADIQMTRSDQGTVIAEGGRSFVLDPWRIDDGGILSPLGYTYAVPMTQVQPLDQPSNRLRDTDA
jgi:hypothetical protein